MAQRKRPSDDVLHKLIKDSGGNLSRVAEAASVSRAAVSLWVQASPEIQQLLQDIRDERVDDAEDSVGKLIRGIPKLDANGEFIGWVQRPDTELIKFILLTLGQSRGYVPPNVQAMRQQPERQALIPGMSNIEKLSGGEQESLIKLLDALLSEGAEDIEHTDLP